MARGAQWWSRQVEAIPEFGTARMAGLVAAVLFALCGLLVADFGALIPQGPHVHRRLVVIIGLAAVALGGVAALVPWQRWRRSATLWLVPVALTLIAAHNYASGGNGHRYNVFFFVVFMWVGLMHPSGTSLAISPLMVAAYFAPALRLHDLPTLAGALSYTLPVCLLIGECSSLVAARIRRSEEDARASERRFRALVHNATDAITVVDSEGVIRWESPSVVSVLGYDADVRIGRSALEFVHDDQVELAAATLAALRTTPAGSGKVELQVRHGDGSWRWCEVRARNLLDDPAVAGIVVNLTDITDGVRAWRALADREESFRLLFAANPQPMWVYDAQTLRFLEVNDAAVHHYGYDRDTFLATAVTAIGPLLEGPTRHVLADGRLIDVEVTSRRMEFAGHDAVLVAIQDVTERNALDAQLRHQAFHDSLTGLSNRALFTDRVEHALGRRTHVGQPILLLLDLDRFKLVNDSLGHSVGDELLIDVARRLESAVRTGDTVARLGGDEFAILLEDCDGVAAERRATRVLRAIAQPMCVGGQQVVMTASLGIAVAEAAMSAGELLRNADVAMYRAKATGGGRLQLFEPAMYAAAARQMELTAALRHAVDEQQFVLHFQPVVDVMSGRVTSMEALVRWRHPDLGLMLPNEFIPVAEDSGLIIPLGAWVLREACLAAALWPEETGVNVNLSGAQLADPAVVDHVRDALRLSGLAPSRLTLEITESVVMQHSEVNMRRLRRLRELGVALAIDDFGTGYSSLSYLRAFPVHELKIDRSFVAGMAGNADALALVRTIIQLAESLSLRTVAEGVETAAQYDALRALGCDRVQGFYVSRPAPAADAMAVADGCRPWHVTAAVPTQR